MTSALRGREGVDQNVTIVLIGCVNGIVTRGEGFRNSKILRTSFAPNSVYVPQNLRKPPENFQSGRCYFGILPPMHM